MKINLLTFCGGTNYGTALQAYALFAFLKSIGHDVEVIRYYDNHLVCQKPRTLKRVRFDQIINKLEYKTFHYLNRGK